MKSKKGRTRASVLFLFIKVMFISMIINLFIIVGAVAAYNAYKYCTTSPYFFITDVRITGNVSLSYEDILGLGGEKLGKSIFLVDISSIHKDIESHPMIKTASVEKEYPSRIIISVAERTPFAVLNCENIQYIIDEEGVILSKNKKSDFHLPEILGIALRDAARNGDRIVNERLSRGIEILTGLKRLRLDNISAVNIKDKRMSVLTAGVPNIKIVLDNNYIENGISKFRILSRILKDKMGDVSAINLSFRDKAVVTWLNS